MPVHENSIESYHQLDKASRQSLILKVYSDSAKALTDKQVAAHFGFTDPNKVRPRITELVNAGKLFEMEEKFYDEKTKRHVRLCSTNPVGAKVKSAQEPELGDAGFTPGQKLHALVMSIQANEPYTTSCGYVRKMRPLPYWEQYSIELRQREQHSVSQEITSRSS